MIRYQPAFQRIYDVFSDSANIVCHKLVICSKNLNGNTNADKCWMFFPHFCDSSIMLERLQKKWKVKGPQLALIICTFAIGGSLTGFAGKKIMNWLAIQQDWLWAILYILLITLLWPMAVLLVSIPFGQFPFFIKYIRKIGVKMGVVRSREPGVGSRETGES